MYVDPQGQCFKAYLPLLRIVTVHGVDRSIVVQSPSCPILFDPQQVLSRIAQV